MIEITPNEARHIAAPHADMAFALDCPVEQVEERIAECCRTYGILATQEALSKAIALGVKAEFATLPDASLVVPPMVIRPLPKFPEITAQYASDIRETGPFYTRAPYSKRGNKRK